jgi:hypothetical protein
MGGSQSQNKVYARGLAEVARSCKWRVGLIVDVKGYDPLVVSDIRPVLSGDPAGTLRVGENMSDIIFIYYYSGDRITVDPVDNSQLYEIYLKKLPQGKIGGGRRQVKNLEVAKDGENIKSIEDKNHSADLIEFDEPDRPNFMMESDFTVGKKISDKDCSREDSCDDRSRDIFKSADGNAPAPAGMKYPDEHPDDNIADD